VAWNASFKGALLIEGAVPSGAVLVIGDEILSGRTQDTNVAAIARFLGGLGIDLCEVRIVPDQEPEIVAALNALRSRYTYVFTTGGIGPTHDDITADAVGVAFGLPVQHHPEAMALLKKRYAPGEFNEMRQRMARMPKGASLIKNPVSTAPGFQIGNVFVMAGVPKIMQAMLEDVAPRLAPGIPMTVKTITVGLPEGQIAAALLAIQERHRTLSIGSYPFFPGAGLAPGMRAQVGTALVVRGRDAAEAEAAAEEICAMVRGFGAEPGVS
jgi:molybdenum cofactor synthesis domain-containing protein